MQLEKLPSIWHESPLTINYSSSKGASIDRTRRFDIDSIYYKDDPTKPKKKVDQFMFPMQLLQDFRKNIREVSKSKDKIKLKRNSSYEEDEEKPSVGGKINIITKRLYKKPDPLLGSHDSFGNRCSFHEKEAGQVCRLPYFKSQSLNSSAQKLYVTATNRIDLSKPSNFNPGPGTYLKDMLLTGKSNSIISEQNSLKRKTRQRTLLESISSTLQSKNL